MKAGRAKLVAWVACAVLASGVFSLGAGDGTVGPATAQAQNIGQRAVIGSVVNDTSAPVSGATVFLKNLKTKSIRSYTSAPDGRFRFTQVNMAEDHELWAEKDGKKSAIKTVSSWDARKEFETELKLK
jgi:hypothetical protein